MQWFTLQQQAYTYICTYVFIKSVLGIKEKAGESKKPSLLLWYLLYTVPFLQNDSAADSLGPLDTEMEKSEKAFVNTPKTSYVEYLCPSSKLKSNELLPDLYLSVQNPFPSPIRPCTCKKSLEFLDLCCENDN
jgi:hypothetical protein